MKRTDLPADLQQLLSAVQYASIASVCPDGSPWNTPVSGVFDEELNLYWASWTQNQHSLNIAASSNIFVTVYDSRTAEGVAVGLYLQMKAKKLTKWPQIEQARRVYTTNFGEDGTHDPFAGTCPRRLYKATPYKIWCNGDDYIRGNFVDVRLPLVA
jgi:uncharacterized protein YhbP (UPF0306 family)